MSVRVRRPAAAFCIMPRHLGRWVVKHSWINADLIAPVNHDQSSGHSVLQGFFSLFRIQCIWREMSSGFRNFAQDPTLLCRHFGTDAPGKLSLGPAKTP